MSLKCRESVARDFEFTEANEYGMLNEEYGIQNERHAETSAFRIRRSVFIHNQNLARRATDLKKTMQDGTNL